AVAAAAARDDRRLRVRAADLGEEAEFDLDHPGRPRRGDWRDYVEGVARSLELRGARLRGADVVLTSSVPRGAGLSSSAAVEVSVGFALATLSDAEVSLIDIALAGQRAEHEWAGANVGIMDQFVAALGRRGHALLIDCRSLEARSVPLDTSEVVVAVCDTHVRHALAASAYNERRAECERGVELLRAAMPEIKALRDVSVTEFERYENLLPEPVRRRVRHVVTENERTLAAAEALRKNDLWEMGRLMDRSHRSLRDDYEVSSTELDAMVEIAGNFGGVLGARMTGGGFGGSTVNLVRRDAVAEFRETVEREYNRATGLPATVLVSEPGDGAGEIEG
ncbi:MAG: galactokinase, partial [Acidobacteriota bacterium]|nr:galactokinase [Acidobacteriota bacterium]